MRAKNSKPKAPSEIDLPTTKELAELAVYFLRFGEVSEPEEMIPLASGQPSMAWELKEQQRQAELENGGIKRATRQALFLWRYSSEIIAAERHALEVRANNSQFDSFWDEAFAALKLDPQDDYRERLSWGEAAKRLFPDCTQVETIERLVSMAKQQKVSWWRDINEELEAPSAAFICQIYANHLRGEAVKKRQLAKSNSLNAIKGKSVKGGKKSGETRRLKAEGKRLALRTAAKSTAPAKAPKSKAR